MKKLSSFLVIAGFAVTLAGSVMPAGATPSQAVTITLKRNGAPDRAPVGWYTEPGSLFDDSGSWTIDKVDQGAIPAPTEFNIHFYTTETGTNGTFRMELHDSSNQSHENTLWEITGGTGAYKKLRGHGTYSVEIIGGVRYIHCAGEVHFA